MVAREIVALAEEQTLRQLRETLEKHHPEAKERLDRYLPVPGGAPNSLTMPQQSALFMAECVEILTELVDGLLEQQRPRGRGRPRKAQTK